MFCEKSNHSVIVILCLCYSFLLQYRWRRWWGSNLRWCQGHETPGEGNGAKIWGGGGVWPGQVFKATSVHWTYRRWLFVCQCSKIRWFEWSVLLYILHNRVRRYVKMLQVIQKNTNHQSSYILIHGSSLLSLHFSITTEHQYIYWILYLFCHQNICVPLVNDYSAAWCSHSTIILYPELRETHPDDFWSDFFIVVNEKVGNTCIWDISFVWDISYIYFKKKQCLI